MRPPRTQWRPPAPPTTNHHETQIAERSRTPPQSRLRVHETREATARPSRFGSDSEKTHVKNADLPPETWRPLPACENVASGKPLHPAAQFGPARPTRVTASSGGLGGDGSSAGDDRRRNSPSSSS